jgi:hypothetical protein
MDLQIRIGTQVYIYLKKTNSTGIYNIDIALEKSLTETNPCRIVK